MADQLNGNGKRGIDEIHEESADPTGSAVASESADDGVTMLDVLQDEQELEEDANVSDLFKNQSRHFYLI